MRTLSGFLVLFNTVAFAAEPLPPPPPPPPPSSDFHSEAPPAPPPIEKPEPKAPKTNWARGAAYSGFAMGAVVISLGVVSHFTGHGYEGTLTSGNWYVAGSLMMLGATLVTAIGAPIIYSGGKSARWTSSITGLLPLRIGGWIAFGVGLAFQIGAIFSNDVPSWVGGLLGGSALAMFGADALRSASEAADVAVMASNESGFRMMPIVSILPGRNGNAPGPVLGFAGIF